MGGSVFSLIVNFVIIVMLGATIVYAARLSHHIRVFRDGRKDLDKLVGDLGAQIQRADGAIATLRDAIRDAGKDLQNRIGEARGLADELQVMTGSGNKLASRLEKLAEFGRPAQSVAPAEEHPVTRQRDETADTRKAQPARVAAASAERNLPELPSPERRKARLAAGAAMRRKSRIAERPAFDDGANALTSLPEERELPSQAEKELLDALRRRQPNEADAATDRKSETGRVS